MDVVEYLKEAMRMCDTTKDCEECPFHNLNATFPCHSCPGHLDVANPEKAVEIVENWAAEHPKKTRQSEFLKVFPSVYKTDGIIAILPCSLDIEFGSNNYCNTVSCYDCRKEYWLTEVE